MARYKPYDLNQSKMIPLSYADQIVEGSFEYALNEIVEEHLDLTVFEHRYHNDETGRSAYDPKVKKRGPTGNEQKSNLTDPESAKMTTSHGVIQGYNGLAVVDERAQIVVHAEAHPL
jgi:hypothetical protein